MNLLENIQLTLLHAGKADLDQKWNHGEVISPFSRLYLVTKGQAHLYHHETSFELTAGNLYLIPSYTYSKYWCPDHHTQYYLGFLEQMGEGLSIYDMYETEYQTPALEGDQALFDRLLALNPNRFLVDDRPKEYDNMPTLLNFKNRNNLLSPAEYTETKGILMVLLSRFLQKSKKQAGSSSFSRNYISSTIRYIHLNLNEQLTIQQLAENVHLNPDYFSRLFTSIMGIRPIKYIQIRRIERAQLLLATTSYSLEEIAQMVGLNNRSYFSRLFKTHTGVSPGSYRNTLWTI